MPAPKNHIITITQAVPDKNPIVSAANKDTVTFVDGGGGPWSIVFQSPFRDHVISTGNPAHANLKVHGKLSLGNCSYLIFKGDTNSRRVGTRRLTADGGGIIIDN